MSTSGAAWTMKVRDESLAEVQALIHPPVAPRGWPEPDPSWRMHLDMARECPARQARRQAAQDLVAAVHQRVEAQELAALTTGPGRTRKRCAGINVTNTRRTP